MTESSKSAQSGVLYGVSNALGVFSVALAMGVCSNLGIYAGLISAVIASLFGGFTARRQMAPTYLVFLVFMLTAFQFGCGAAMIAYLLASFITFIAALDKNEYLKRFTDRLCIAGLLLAAALCMTVMETTLYFGIGASGDSVLEMIKDYISRGFHPNWRGILYGTITLVIMITYPRKFKTFKNKLPASFVSIAVTLVLNLFLNPNAATTAIDEVGYYSFSPADFLGGALFNGLDNSSFLRGNGVLFMFSVVAMAAVMSYSFIKYDENTTRKERVSLAACGLVCALAGGVPVTFTERESRGGAGGVTCAVLAAAMFAARPLIVRIPVATLAVILIVTAWQAVDWHGLKLVLTGGAGRIIQFVLQMLLAVACGIAYTVTATYKTSQNNFKRGGKKQQ